MSDTLNIEHFKSLKYYKKLSEINNNGIVIYGGTENNLYLGNQYISWNHPDDYLTNSN